MPCPKVTQLIVYGLLYKFAVKWIFDNLKIIWIKKKSKKIGMSEVTALEYSKTLPDKFKQIFSIGQMNLSYWQRERLRLKLKAICSNLQQVKKFLFLLMLYIQFVMSETKIISGITDTKIHDQIRRQFLFPSSGNVFVFFKSDWFSSSSSSSIVSFRACFTI